MDEKKVLIVNSMHESIVSMLEYIGISADYIPDIGREEIIKSIGNYWGIIIRSKLVLDEEFFHAASQLKVIARAGSGLDQIDLKIARQRKIEIFNAPEGNMDSLGEHALGLILSLLNNIVKSNSEVKNQIWNRSENRGYELNGKTVGIMGYGHMGSSLANKLSSFGCKVIAIDVKDKIEKPSWLKIVDLNTFRKEVDILSIHIPMNSENRALLNYQWLNSFEKKFWLINTARGEVLVLKDLLKLLDEGKIIGAALDVLENENINRLSKEEKVVFNDLCKRNNTILTPHIGGWSYESYKRINEVLVSKIQNFILHNG